MLNIVIVYILHTPKMTKSNIGSTLLDYDCNLIVLIIGFAGSVHYTFRTIPRMMGEKSIRMMGEKT